MTNTLSMMQESLHTMSASSSLFRPEVLQHKDESIYYGAVFVNTPFSYTFVTCASSILFILTIIFILYTDITEHCTVTGYLNSDQGMTHVYPQHAGIILKQYQKQGARVKKNDPLFLIEKKWNGPSGFNHDTTLQQLKKNRQLLQQELNLKKQEIIRLKKLLHQHYISFATYAEKQQALLMRQQDYHRLIREIAEHQNSRWHILRASRSGTIANIMYYPGQWVDASKPIATILPKHSHLIAQIYVPSMYVRFLHKNARLIIHYDAYPYQQFGHAIATILSISQSPLTDAQDEKLLQIKQPYYTIIAKLEPRLGTLLPSHPKILLKYGMTFSAFLFGKNQKIWQWFLHPFQEFSV